MKLSAALLLSICVAFSVAACGGGGDTNYEFPDGPENPGQTEPGDGDNETFAATELTGYPAGLKVWSFVETFTDGKTCSGYYAIADLKSNPKLRFNPVLSSPAATPSAIFAAHSQGTPQVAINGGFFWSGASLSLLVADGEVKSIENQSVSRTGPNGGTMSVYPVRSAFGQMSDGTFVSRWIYCVAADGNKPYAFPSTLGNNEKTKTYNSSPPVPATDGGTLWQPRNAIGGGPRLVENGDNVAEASYWGECLDEGGAAGMSRQPRTAIGATADGKLIVLVCDGRQMNGSSGYTLPEMAARLVELGASTAVNLDGGGSSTFVGREGKVLNRPSDSGTSGAAVVQRKVPTAVVVSLAD
jgi:hypothetical protein